MTLDERAPYPHAMTYLVRLHVDADPQSGYLAGRLEHLASGRQFAFHSAAELIACLAQASLEFDSPMA